MAASTTQDAAKPVQNGDTASPATENAVAEDGKVEEDASSNLVFQVTVKLPHKPYKLPVMVSTQEQVQDLRQSVIDQPDTFQYSCFHLEHDGTPINDFVELSDVAGLQADSEITLVEDPYTEKDSKLHVVRVRDLIGASGDRADAAFGINSGESVLDTVSSDEAEAAPNGAPPKGTAHPIAEYDFDAPPSLQTILPPVRDVAPKTIKALAVSPWNPPPHHLRQRGHLLYLQLTTNEGEQFQITSHVTGFYVNKSSNTKFDPFPRQTPKSASAHSLLTLISKISPSFDASFRSLQEHNGKRDPLTNLQITNTIPASPWITSSQSGAMAAHQPDLMRTQESFLLTGADSAEALRDWNEEFQSTHEQPKASVQDRVFRERITSKLFADFNEAAIRGAIMCARGEITPLNPTEHPMSQIFVHNNIFFSFGADGVGTFKSEGGDPAARVVVGKDVSGVKLINQLDVDGLFTPGTVVVDYLGRRVVCQSLVPGIFKQREPDEHQVSYGGVEGRDVIADEPAFRPVFSKVSKAFHIKKHNVWDKDGKKFELEGSVETKGMLGTDGRKYALDLYRLTPLDINWVERFWCDAADGETKPEERNYPHRMSVLRPELIESFWRLKMSEYVNDELTRRRKEKAEGQSGEAAAKDDETAKDAPSEEQQERVDISGFSFDFNPDVCCGQSPQTEQEKQEYAEDEQRVRAASEYLTNTVIPDLIKDLDEGDVGFPVDGTSLTKLLHKRGVNMRYLGDIAAASQGKSVRLQALTDLAIREMVTRAFKHVANSFLQSLPVAFAASALSHLLNCLLGEKRNSHPKAAVDEDIQFFYPGSDWSYTELTPKALQKLIEEQVQQRFRHKLEESWAAKLQSLQVLREVALKLGLQISAKQFVFDTASEPNGTRAAEAPATNGTTGGSKKKKKTADQKLNTPSTESLVAPSNTTFSPEDIVNFIPLYKGSAPRSMLAEEALEAGRLSLAQNQKELGQELLLESLSLHEQIYGILHPEVARAYHQLSMLYYQLDMKEAATELARKAVIQSERTLGLDHNETVLSYLNLGLFEHATGDTRIALHYIRHALDLWKIAYGPGHPDSVTTMNNAAVMLQSLKLYHPSRVWFERSLALCSEVSGPTSVGAGTLCFQLAQALSLDQDSKGAVARMREAYNIFLNKLGAEDRNTKESEYWLEQLTQNAVSVARHAKDVQARRLRRIQLGPSAGGVGASLGSVPRPQPAPGQSSAEAAGHVRTPSAGVDPRSVDELIRFIEGGGDSTKGKSSSKKRGQKANPKKRGTRTNGAAT